jgi:hypothetical protein
LPYLAYLLVVKCRRNRGRRISGVYINKFHARSSCALFDVTNTSIEFVLRFGRLVFPKKSDVFDKSPDLIESMLRLWKLIFSKTSKGFGMVSDLAVKRQSIMIGGASNEVLVFQLFNIWMLVVLSSYFVPPRKH